MKNNIKNFLHKTRRLIRLLLIITLVVVFCIVISLRAKDYSVKYELNNITIKETYDKEKELYYFNFHKGKSNFDYVIKSKYLQKKELITDANIKKDCLSAKNELENFTICKKNQEYVSPYYKSLDTSKLSQNYKNITLYNLKDFKYYIWNYKYFVSLSNDNKSQIKLFEDDLYKLDLIYKDDRYLYIPDYNSEYYFKKIYKLDSKTNKIKELKLNRKIYFDSYFLGNNGKYLYLYDINKEKEYKINTKSGIVNKNSFEILNNGVWEKTSQIKLNNKKVKFIQDELFKFDITNKTLYYITPVSKIKMVDFEVDKLLYSNKNEALVLSKNTIYYVSLKSETTKVMKYSEWEFNNKNIYIFKK